MAGNIKQLLTLVFILVFSSISFDSYSQDYLSVKAANGDGIGVLLNRYNLASHSCNKDSFLKINGLKSSDFLQLSKSYQLPIRVYTFNGTSIRSSIGIDDYKVALSIQKYNEELEELGVKETSFRTDKDLWVPIHAQNCPAETVEEYVEISSSATKEDLTVTNKHTVSTEEALRTEKFPIFGKDYEQTPILSENLKGHVYYLVSGHGGPDPGAIGKKDGHMLCEDEYAYDVTLRLARNLLQHGATVYMITRDDDGIRDEEYLESDKDETVWYNQKIPLNHVKRLKQRSSKINELYEKHKKEGALVQRVIEIHIDSRYVEQKVDIFFYYYPGSDKGKNLATQMYKVIKSEYDTHQQSRGYRGVVRGRDLHTLRETKPPVVYIELGNITNDFDQQRLLIVNNRQAIANWLAQGILTYDET